MRDRLKLLTFADSLGKRRIGRREMLQRAAATGIRLYGGGNRVALPGVAMQNHWFGDRKER